MARAAVKREMATPAGGGHAEERALSETVAKMRRVVRNLNRIASRMDRTLARRLEQLEALHR